MKASSHCGHFLLTTDRCSCFQKADGSILQTQPLLQHPSPEVAWHCMEIWNPGSMPYSPLWAQDWALGLGFCFLCRLIQSLHLVSVPAISDPGPGSYPLVDT